MIGPIPCRPADDKDTDPELFRQYTRTGDPQTEQTDRTCFFCRRSYRSYFGIDQLLDWLLQRMPRDEAEAICWAFMIEGVKK